MAKDIRVRVTRERVATGTGYGYPLIFEGKATKAIPYTECSSIDDVIRVVGGITENDDESVVATKTETAKATNIYKAAWIYYVQKEPNAQIAICADTAVATTGLAKILHKGWRQLIVVSTDTEGEDTKKVISDYIEMSKSGKQYFVTVATAAEAKALGDNEHTNILVHEEEDATIPFPEAGVVGSTSGKMPGSFTYHNTEVNGLTPQDYTDAELNEIYEANANAFITKSNRNVLSGGFTASGEYIDVIEAQDWISQQIAHRLQLTLINMDKVSFDNKGIAILENVTSSVLKEAAENDMIAEDGNGVYYYSTQFKPRSETNAADRAKRVYKGGSARFTLANAIHEADINLAIEI